MKPMCNKVTEPKPCVELSFTNRKRSRLWILAFITILVIILGMGSCATFSMPGQSFHGPLPPLTAEEREISRGLSRHVRVLADEIGERHVGRPKALEQAASYVESILRGLGYEPSDQWYQVDSIEVRNIEVEIRGGEKAEEIIVLGAHYDSVPGCPAANDNASGVAAILEIARLLSVAQPHPKKTIRLLAFVNEEPPFFQTDRMGSVIYARRCRERGERIGAMLSVETIGYYSDAPNSQQFPPLMGLFYPNRGDFIAIVGNVASRGLVRSCIRSFRRHAQFPSQGLAAPECITGVGWSDHWSFWKEGYPALMITDTAPFRYPYYHDPADTPDKLDYDRTARVVAGLARVIVDLANE